MVGKQSACIAAVLLCALIAGPLAKAAGGGVLLFVDPCFAPNATSVASILAVEIGRPVKSVNLESAQAAQQEHATPVVVIHVTCEEPTRIDVKVHGAGLQNHRRVDLGAVDARVRARVVALAAAEFFEPAPPLPAPPPSPKPPPAPIGVTVPASSPQRNHVVLVHASGRRFVQGAHNSWGGGVGLWVAQTPWLALWGDLTAEQGRAARTAGDVRLRSVAVRSGASWQYAFGQFGVAAGAGATLGYVQAQGEPNDGVTTPDTVTGAWAGALARADVFYDLGRVRLQTFAEGGQTFLAIRGRFNDLDQRLWRNPWLSVGCAGGLRF